MRNNKRNSSFPIYTFALIWLIISMLVSFLKLKGVFFAALTAIAAAATVSRYLSDRNKKAGSAQETAAQTTASVVEIETEAESPYSPEVSAVIQEGRVALREMGRLRGSITDSAVKEKINAIMEISDKIIRDAIDDPSDVPQIRRFLDYYLPTTIKLLNAYDRMDSTGVEGENISGSKRNISEMLDTTLESYKKLLDSLFANQALDIDAEIRAMNSVLAQEGIGGSTLDWKTFMQQYENNNDEKGTTQNG